MTKEKIKMIFDKHFNSIGISFKQKIIDKKDYTFDDFYHSPLNKNDLLSGSIFNTCNIRYGDFLEEIINEFLHENGAIISLDRKKGNYDLLFEYRGVLYVGEIKIRDNHDSTKKKGQIQNLINKVNIQKNKNKDKKVVAILYFIDHYERKNRHYYISELNKCIQNKNFDDAKIFYGDEIFNEFNLQYSWNEIKKNIISFNKIAKQNNYIKKIIIDYLKELETQKKENYDEILKLLKK